MESPALEGFTKFLGVVLGLNDGLGTTGITVGLYDVKGVFLCFCDYAHPVRGHQLALESKTNLAMKALYPSSYHPGHFFTTIALPQASQIKYNWFCRTQT